MGSRDDKTLEHYAMTKAGMTAKIAICLALDSLLFILWVVLAWVAHKMAAVFEAHGLAGWAARAFEFASQIGTLILAIVYVVKDVIAEIREVLGGSAGDSADTITQTDGE